MPASDDTVNSLLQTLQALLHYYAPPIEQTATNAGVCLTAAVGGIVLAFYSARIARGLMTLVGFAIGGAIGYQAAQFFEAPAAVITTIAGVVLAFFAYRTYRLWLGLASIGLIVTAALAYQLAATGDLARYLPEDLRAVGMAAQSRDPSAPPQQVRLATPEEQRNNLHPTYEARLAELRKTLVEQVGEWGLTGWIVPVIGLIVGILLMIWAIQLFGVIWLALVGAGMAVSGGIGLILMALPDVRADVMRRPDLIAGSIAGIWVLGLICQAKASYSVSKKSTSRPTAEK
jgi:hypothetical protein